MGCIHTPNPYSDPCGDCRARELEAKLMDERKRRVAEAERATKAEAALEEARSESAAHDVAATQYERDIADLRRQIDCGMHDEDGRGSCGHCRFCRGVERDVWRDRALKAEDGMTDLGRAFAQLDEERRRERDAALVRAETAERFVAHADSGWKARAVKAEAALEEARSESAAHDAAATQYEQDLAKLRAELAEAESYGRANGFREWLRTLGGGDEVYERAIATWGRTAQLGMVQEECAELIAAIHRRQRGRCSDEDVVEEAADVWIMLEQLVRILGHELVAEALDRKLARLRSRLDASPHRTEAGR